MNQGVLLLSVPNVLLVIIIIAMIAKEIIQWAIERSGKEEKSDILKDTFGVSQHGS